MVAHVHIVQAQKITHVHISTWYRRTRSHMYTIMVARQSVSIIYRQGGRAVNRSIHADTYAYKLIRIQTHTRRHIRTHADTYAYTQTHTHTNTYT